MSSAKVKFTITSLTTFLVAAVLVLSVSVRSSDAQNGAVGLLFSPPVIDINLDPGSTYTESIKLENRSESAQTFYPSAMDFVPRGEEGGQQYLLPEESDETYSLAQWITLDRSPIVLNSMETAIVTFTISVPESAEPGGRYASVFFGTEPTAGAGQLTGARVATQTGPVVLVRVAGEVEESGRVIEFGSDKSFYEYPPVHFFTRFENMGSVHVKPVGEIAVSNVFGQVVARLPINEKQGNVLPESVRRFEVDWNDRGFVVGKFTAALSLTYGTQSQTVGEQISFWVVPWKVLLVALALILIVGYALKRGIRKYNESIIDKALHKESPDSAGEVDKSTAESTDVASASSEDKNA